MTRILPFSWRPTNDARCVAAPPDRRHWSRVLLGTVCTIVAMGALASLPSPALAYVSSKTAPTFHDLRTDRARKEIPKGPLQIIISVDQQKLHLYSGGTHVADAPVATGVPDHPTPLGIFNIIQKQREHRSNIYSNAPMPFMERITWSGVALHEGVNLGHPASHGCIRMSHDFAVRLWALTRLGVGVVIARPELRPEEISDPHLFIHKDQDKPTDAEPATSLAPTRPMPPATAGAELLKTAETVESDKKADTLREAGQNTSVTPILAAIDSVSPPSTPSDEPVEEEPEIVPLPPSKPAELDHSGDHGPIAIFVSGKNKKIYVRQDFLPLFDAAIEIDHPEQRLGTHVFTALEYADDRASFRWNVISLPAEQTARQAERRFDKVGGVKRETMRIAKSSDPRLEETPQQALARIEIPQDVIDQISQLIVPGSSLIVSDQGLGEETDEGTNFIVVTH